MEKQEHLWRAYGIAASLLKSDLRSGDVDKVCEVNSYGPEDTQAIKHCIEQIGNDLVSMMNHHLKPPIPIAWGFDEDGAPV